MPLHFVGYYVAFRHTAMASRLLQASPVFASARLTMERLKELVRRYFVALLAPAAIALVMQVTWPFFQSAPVAPYFVAVIFCAWYGGLGPGLLSVVISFFLSDFLFIEPYFFFGPSKEFNLGRVLLFAVVGPFISVMSELMHRESRRAEVNLESARQAEEARRQSDANYRALFEGSALPMWVYDIETLAFLAVNEAAVYHYGYSREEFLALTIVDIRPPEDVPAFRAALAEAAAGFGAAANIWRHTKKDGSIIDVETTHNLLDFAGRPARLVVANDVTKRRQAEEALHQSHSQLQNILDSLFAFVGVFSTEGVVLEANRAPLEAAALEREEVLGKFLPETYWWSYSAAVQDRLRAVLQRAAQGEVVRYDEVIRVANDQRITIDVVFGPLRDAEGKITQIVGSAVDITERKRAEALLQAKEQEFRAIVENAPDQIIRYDREFRRTYVNPAVARAYGLPAETLIGKPIGSVIQDAGLDVEEGELAHLRQLIAAVFDTGELYDYEMNWPSPAGRRYYSVRFFPELDLNGSVINVLGISRDITERKHAEQALKATSEQLRALSASLQFAREEEGTRIARELHDELGSALTSLRWSLDEIDSLLSTDSSKLATDNLRAKIATMTTLVEGTLQTVRRISSELRPGVLDEVGLIPAIEWEAQQFEARTGIVCYFDSSMPDIHLTREQSTAIFRILQEALTNVLRHAKATKVEVTLKEEQGGFVLTIGDDGRGISEEEKSGEKSLGLLGMRERAHLIGGEVSITSLENQGTTVTVRLPVLRAPAFEE